MSGWTLFVDELVLQGLGDLDDMVERGKIGVYAESSSTD